LSAIDADSLEEKPTAHIALQWGVCDSSGVFYCHTKYNVYTAGACACAFNNIVHMSALLLFTEQKLYIELICQIFALILDSV